MPASVSVPGSAAIDADRNRRRATPAEVLHRKEAAQEFILTGFKQTQNMRHYLFQIISGGAAGERSRRDVSVDADLDMMRRHGISIQEMPLLCRRLLELKEEGRPPDLTPRTLLPPQKIIIRTSSKPLPEPPAAPIVYEILVFSEQDMAGHAQLRDDAKRQQELRRRRPVTPVRTSTNPNATNPNVIKGVVGAV